MFHTNLDMGLCIFDQYTHDDLNTLHLKRIPDDNLVENQYIRLSKSKMETRRSGDILNEVHMVMDYTDWWDQLVFVLQIINSVTSLSIIKYNESTYSSTSVERISFESTGTTTYWTVINYSALGT